MTWYGDYSSETGERHSITLSTDTEEEALAEASEKLTPVLFGEGVGAWHLAGVRHDDEPKPHRLVIKAKLRHVPMGTMIRVTYARDPEDRWRRVGGGTLSPSANLLGLALTVGKGLTTGKTENVRGELESVNASCTLIWVRERLGVLQIKAKGPARMLEVARVVDIVSEATPHG